MLDKHIELAVGPQWNRKENQVEPLYAVGCKYSIKKLCHLLE